MKAHLMPLMSSERTEWETPKLLFDELNAEFNFELDLAANEENHKCRQWYGPGGIVNDSLAASWAFNRCWLNPPYGKELPLWVKKAYESTRNDHTLVVMLIPSRTDTRYWHDYVMKAEEIRYVRGRLRFVGANASAPFPSAIVVFGNVTLIAAKDGEG